MAIYNDLKNTQLVFSNNYVQGASYIMNDGKFIDFRSSNNLLLNPENQNRTRVTHIDFDRYLIDNEFISVENKDHKLLVNSDNAIAINDGTNLTIEKPYFVLPPSKPTNAQFTSLLNWLDYIATISDLIQIENTTKNVMQRFYFKKPENDGWLTDDIIKEIKKMYN